MEICEFHHHRVDRMLSFSPVVGIGGYTLAGEGVGWPNSDEETDTIVL
jgi:hypothetical protein